MITLKLYTNKFMHEGKLHMSVSVMAYNDGAVVSCFGTEQYVTDEFCGIAAARANSIAYSTKRLLEGLGHEVEIAPELVSYAEACDALHAEFVK